MSRRGILGVEPVTFDEVRRALQKLKTGSDDGLVAEVMRTGHHGLLMLLAELFTEILQGGSALPAELTRIRVLFKKGDPMLAKNYRPIAILPVMAKLLSIVLYNRIVEHIETQLSREGMCRRLAHSTDSRGEIVGVG